MRLRWGVVVAWRLILAVFLVFNPLRSVAWFIPRLSVDYGGRKVGLAYNDLTGRVRPLITIQHNGTRPDLLANRILECTRVVGGQQIVVGLPLSLRLPASSNVLSSVEVERLVQMSDSHSAKACLRFARILSYCSQIRSSSLNTPSSSIPVVMCDERYTTRAAELRLSNSNQKASEDALAAAVLLEGFLQAGNTSMLSVRPLSPPYDDLPPPSYNRPQSPW